MRLIDRGDEMDESGWKKRLRQFGALAFALLLSTSAIAGVAFVGTQPLTDSDHDGTVAASDGSASHKCSISAHGNYIEDVYVWEGRDLVLTVGRDSNLKAWNRGDCSLNWSYTASSEIWSLAVDEQREMVYIGRTGPEIEAIDPDTQSKQWGYTGHSWVSNSLVVNENDGKLYSASNDDTVHAIDISSQTRDWSYGLGSNGEVIDYDATNGNIYAGDTNGKIYKIDKTGGGVWTNTDAAGARALSVNEERGEVLVGEGGGNSITYLDTAGNFLWDYSTGDHTTAAHHTENHLYAVSADTTLHELNFDGTQSWTQATNHSTSQNRGMDISTDDYVAWIGGNDGQLEAYSVGTPGVSVSGGVTDSDGNTLEGATVSADDPNVDSVTTASDGSYELTVPETGTYNLTATDGSYEDSQTVDVPDGGLSGVDFQFTETVTGAVENTDGEPITHAEVSANGKTVQVDDTGAYSIGLVQGTHDVTAHARGYFNQTQSVDVGSSGATQDFALKAMDKPFVSDYAPEDGYSSDSSSVTLEAEIGHHDGGTVNYTFYHRQGGSGDFVPLASGEVSDGTVVSTTVDDASGQNEWFVRLDDGSDVVDTETWTFRSPGSLSFYDYVSEAQITDREITVELRPMSDVWDTRTLTTSTGQVNFDGIDPSASLVWHAEVRADGYNSTSWTFYDLESDHNVLLDGEDSGVSFYEQTFALDDESGNFPPSTSMVELEKYYLGEWQRQDIDGFGDANRGHLKVEDGETYRVKVWNARGNYRVVGEYTASKLKADGVVTVNVESVEDETEDYPPENDDETSDWESEDDYNSPPTVSFSSSPLDPIVGETVTFDASGSADYDGTIESYEWQFGDGATASGQSVSHSFSSAGSQSVTLTVTDDAGLSRTTSRTVYVGETEEDRRAPPTASLEVSPGEPNVSEVVQLDARDSVSEAGTIEAVRWDVNGDGSFSESGETLDHVFETSGFKQVCVEVEDDAGVTDQACQTIVVYDPYPPKDAEDGRAGSDSGGIGGPTDGPGSEGNPMLVGGLLVGGGLFVAHRTGNLPVLANGAKSAASAAGKGGAAALGGLGRALRRLLGVFRR